MLSYLLGNKGRDLENLFSSSFALIKAGNLKAPYMNRLIFSGALHCLLFSSLIMLIYKWHAGLGFFVMFFTLIALVPYSFLFHIKMRAQLSWLSYAGITNKPASTSAAKAQISKIAWSLRLLAMVELMLANREGENSKNSGIMNALKQMLIGLIATTVDVAENYLLPTIVIESTSIQNSVQKVIQMKKNIPASLVGAFGIDLIGNAVSSFSALIYLMIVAGGVGLSVLTSYLIPPALNTAIGGHHLFLFPLILSFFVCSYIRSFIKISATSLKAIYFSIFYTSINHPLEIIEIYRDKVTNYLNFNDSSYASALKKDLKSFLPNVSKGPMVTSLAMDPELFQMVQMEIGAMQQSGRSDQEITELLLAKGWPKDQILTALQPKRKSI